MQAEKAAELRKRWGKKPCVHPALDKEYYLGSATGDYVCTQCGEANFGSDWNKKKADEGKKAR